MDNKQSKLESCSLHIRGGAELLASYHCGETILPTVRSYSGNLVSVPETNPDSIHPVPRSIPQGQ